MRVRFRKSPEGGRHVVHCIRDDGTESYGRIPPHPGIPHDLIHFVVEKTLGLRRAFFGPIASGIAVPDAADAWKTLPPKDRAEAALAEVVVAWFQAPGARGEPPPIPVATLATIETELEALHARWLALAAKETLEVEF